MAVLRYDTFRFPCFTKEVHRYDTFRVSGFTREMHNYVMFRMILMMIIIILLWLRLLIMVVMKDVDRIMFRKRTMTEGTREANQRGTSDLNSGAQGNPRPPSKTFRGKKTLKKVSTFPIPFVA